MTVYIDNARIPARVGRITARWSHLTADTKEELHTFATRIGLKRSWFQDKPNPFGGPGLHWHYDVTDSKRAAAIAAGAHTIDLRQWQDIIRARRVATGGRR
ncbi:MAG TPA: DUF4031 domain-containing protein [Kribbellaceae bacterium]|nr:DUF4031 domain-containing protein [Kribbellaceae bacterium]